MRKAFHFMACVSIILAFASCGHLGKKSSKELEEGKTKVELLDTVKQKLVEQDSLTKELTSKIDTLSSELKSIKTKLSEYKSRDYMAFAAIALAIIALVLTLLKSKGVKEERVNDIFKRNLDGSSRIKELQNQSAQLGSKYSQLSDTIRKVEYDVLQLKQAINALQNAGQQQQDSMEPTEQANEKVGYAKVDREMFFTTIYDSNQEGSVFKINFTSPTEGKFNIISLNKIKSRNDWQKKIVCEGVSIKDAVGYEEIEEGECTKIGDETWQVTKPLKIRLK